MGDAIVNPRRFRNAARRTAGTDKSWVSNFEIGFDGFDLVDEFVVELWISSLVLSSIEEKQRVA